MIIRFWLIALFFFAVQAPSAHAADVAFRNFLQSLWPQAQGLGVSRATFEAATRGLEADFSLPDLVIPGRPERVPQPEFVQAPADYIKETTIARLAEHGKNLAGAHRATLAAVERQFGVPGSIMLAIWGRETDFGRYRNTHAAIRVLATQAFYGRRKELFRDELLLALKMIEEGHVRPAAMKSSWAGAMGLMQFLPSDFYKHAVDFDGDGRRDIWTSVPDALASAAKQLLDKGWQRGRRWGIEVRTPPGTDCTLGVPSNTKPIGEWLRLGFAPTEARALRADDLAEPASLLQPAGSYGPAFLTPSNYFVLKAYNFSDLYVLYVGHLSDRIAGGRPFATPWGRLVQLQGAEVERIQRRLAALGLYADSIDGKAGMKTRAALGAYQKAHGLKVDCWPRAAVLEHMQAGAQDR